MPKGRQVAKNEASLNYISLQEALKGKIPKECPQKLFDFIKALLKSQPDLMDIQRNKGWSEVLASVQKRHI